MLKKEMSKIDTLGTLEDAVITETKKESFLVSVVAVSFLKDIEASLRKEENEDPIHRGFHIHVCTGSRSLLLHLANDRKPAPFLVYKQLNLSSIKLKPKFK